MSVDDEHSEDEIVLRISRDGKEVRPERREHVSHVGGELLDRLSAALVLRDDGFDVGGNVDRRCKISYGLERGFPAIKVVMRAAQRAADAKGAATGLNLAFRMPILISLVSEPAALIEPIGALGISGELEGFLSVGRARRAGEVEWLDCFGWQCGCGSRHGTHLLLSQQ